MTRPVLDVTAGTRAMWFDKTDQRTLFGDARTESITVTDRTRGHQDGTRTLNIAPDVQLDFRALPFPDESFRLVVFDPPHLTRAGAKSWLAARYGVLGLDWRDDLKRVSADQVRQFANIERMHQVRGLSIFAPVMNRLVDISDIENSERIAAKVAASWRLPQATFGIASSLVSAPYRIPSRCRSNSSSGSSLRPLSGCSATCATAPLRR